jgi:hypothetical protein
MTILKIKRGLTSTSAPLLSVGELGYSMGVGTSANGGDRLYIGTGVDTDGLASSIVAIGGKYFTELLKQTPGVLTASAALVVDSNKKLDELLVDNLSLNGNTLSSTSGNLNIGAGNNLIRLVDGSTIVGGPEDRASLSLAGSAILSSLSTGSVALRVGTTGIVVAELLLTSDGILAVPGTIISKAGSNADIVLNPDGTGKVSINGVFTLPNSDGQANQFLKTNGSGVTDWASVVTSVAFSTGTTGLSVTGSPITSSGTFTLGGTLAVASGGTGVTTKTGTGDVVLSNSPVLVTPDLGTPSAVNLTYGLGLPVSTGISGLGANVASFLANASSSNFASALTTKTGTGNVVFSTSPTFTTSLITDSASLDLFNTTATTINFGGAATTVNIGAITGTTTINNAVALKGVTTVYNHILPDTDSVTDLGSSSKRFRTLFLKGSTLDLGGATLSGSAGGGVTMTSINGTPIGNVVSSTGVFTTVTTTGNVTVGGDLTVNGTLTSINSATVEVVDKMIELGKTATPTEATASGAGIQVTGTSAHNFLYNSTTQSWTSSEHLNLLSGKVFAINGVNVLEATALGSTVIGSSLTSVGTLTTGTWSATNIALNKGGTNSSLTAVSGGITYSDATSLQISAAGTAGYFLISGGAGSPTWTNIVDGGVY